MKKFLADHLLILITALVAVATGTGVAAQQPRTAIALQTPFPQQSLEYRQLDEIVRCFEKENAGISVELRPDGPVVQDGIVRHMLARNSPDVFEVPLSELPDLAAKSAILPVTGDSRFNMGRMFASAVSASSYEAGLYAAPFRASSIQLICNGALLAKAGYDPDMPLLNVWSALLFTCSGLRRSAGEGCYPLGMDAADGASLSRLASMLVYQGGATLIEKRDDTQEGKVWHVSVDSSDGLRSMEFLAKLADFMHPKSSVWWRSDLEKAFIDGRIAMLFSDIRTFSEVHAAAPDLPVRAYEAPSDNASASSVDFLGAVIAAPAAKRPGHQEACEKLLAYLCSEHAQKLVMTGGSTQMPVLVPVYRDLLDDPWYAEHPDCKPFLKALWYPVPAVPNASWSEVQRQAFVPQLRLLIAGKVSALEAVKRIDTGGNQALSTYYGYIGHISETTMLGMCLAGIGVFFMVFFAVAHRSKH